MASIHGSDPLARLTEHTDDTLSLMELCFCGCRRPRLLAGDPSLFVAKIFLAASHPPLQQVCLSPQNFTKSNTLLWPHNTYTTTYLPTCSCVHTIQIASVHLPLRLQQDLGCWLRKGQHHGNLIVEHLAHGEESEDKLSDTVKMRRQSTPP